MGRGAAHRAVVHNSLKEIAIAAGNYASDHQDVLPPAAIVGKDGKPLLSWRVALLPYLGHGDLYKQFHLDEPWDSEHNKRLLPLMPRVYAPPGGGVRGEYSTHYRVFVGERTMYLGKAGPYSYRSRYRWGNIPDGTSSTILAVEAAEAVPWTRPDELEYDRNQPLPGLGAPGAYGFGAAMYDGSARVLRKDIDEQTLRWLIEPDDGNVVPSDW
jgi:hypothetical protein